MTRFAQGTDPEYVKTVNDALYGKGHDASIKGDESVREELLEEAEAIGPTGEGPLDEDGTPIKTKTAGFMGLPNLAWFAIGGVVLYYAYQKGMFKKFLK